MPHCGQILPLVARPLAAGLLLVATSACDRTGKVVVVLDTTMRRAGVEVVAFRDDGARGQPSSGVNAASANRDRRRATPLEDSAAMLASRFRSMRDSLNAEVARLDSLDRRTRAYAVRYAEIRRRTLAAEQLRARRDSMYARAAALSGDSNAATVARNGAGGNDPRVSLENAPGLQRHALRDSAVVLELTAGRWSIGAARAGQLLAEPTTLTVISGESDTLRISGAPAPRDDDS